MPLATVGTVNFTGRPGSSSEPLSAIVELIANVRGIAGVQCPRTAIFPTVRLQRPDNGITVAIRGDGRGWTGVTKNKLATPKPHY